eukprot:11402117-Heterocapsa_arctica.AAC.1
MSSPRAIVATVLQDVMATSSWPRWGASTARASLPQRRPSQVWLQSRSASSSPRARPCEPPFGSRQPSEYASAPL